MGGHHDEGFHISGQPFFLPLALEGEGEAGLRLKYLSALGRCNRYKSAQDHRVSPSAKLHGEVQDPTRMQRCVAGLDMAIEICALGVQQ